jgi:hypothetical protein
MRRNMWIPLLGITVTSLACQQTQTQRYSPGSPPTIGDIQSECVELAPTPRTRTDVGIGEEVSCWIDTSTWQDTDICTDSDGRQSEVSDSLGEVIWSVEGLGTVYPIVTDGSAVTLTADFADHDGAATIIATVMDSGTMGEDPPIQKRKVFKVKTPGGIQIIQTTGQPPVEKTRDGK